MMTRILSHTPQVSDRDFTSESSFFQPIGIKQVLGCHALWQRCGIAVVVLCVNSTTIEPIFLNGITAINNKKDFLNITRLVKTLVIIHGSNKTR